MRCTLSRSQLRSVVLVILVGLVGLTSAAGAVEVESDQVTFTWQAASGPVVGYNVFVVRNGSAGSAPELVVASPRRIAQQYASSSRSL